MPDDRHNGSGQPADRRSSEDVVTDFERDRDDRHHKHQTHKGFNQKPAPGNSSERWTSLALARRRLITSLTRRTTRAGRRIGRCRTIRRMSGGKVHRGSELASGLWLMQDPIQTRYDIELD
jgi:hypothetical protein